MALETPGGHWGGQDATRARVGVPRGPAAGPRQSMEADRLAALRGPGAPEPPRAVGPGG